MSADGGTGARSGAGGGPEATTVEATDTVTALLDAAGLAAPDDEVERLARLYPGLRRSIDRFHLVDVGDVPTAAVFRADNAR